MSDGFSFNSPVLVRIPEYDVYIPEIRRNGPIMSYIALKVKQVVNIIDRGLNVEFKDRNVQKETLALVKQYTILANEENERVGKPIYKVPINAQNTLVRDLNLKEEIRVRREVGEDPWKGRGYGLPNIPSRPPVVVKKKQAPKVPKLYEFFQEQIDTALPSQGFDDLSL
jgi:hypothetical protein